MLEPRSVALAQKVRANVNTEVFIEDSVCLLFEERLRRVVKANGIRLTGARANAARKFRASESFFGGFFQRSVLEASEVSWAHGIANAAQKRSL